MPLFIGVYMPADYLKDLLEKAKKAKVSDDDLLKALKEEDLTLKALGGEKPKGEKKGKEEDIEERLTQIRSQLRAKLETESKAEKAAEPIKPIKEVEEKKHAKEVINLDI